MPLKRRIGKERREGVSGDAWAFMLDQAMPEGCNPFRWREWKADLHHLKPRGLHRPEPSMVELWQAHGSDVLHEWVDSAPGTRPRCWWGWTAPREAPGRHLNCWYDGLLPAPRERLGGIGTPQCEVWAVMPSWPLGIPTSWVDEDDPDGKWVTPDPHSPPLFESQAAYLRRLGLLLPGELRRLGSEDFLPEPIPVAE